jgi:hypothetical protein
MADKIVSPKSKVATPLSEETALELAKQLKRVADAMDRQHKFMMMTGGKEKIQERVAKQS